MSGSGSGSSSSLPSGSRFTMGNQRHVKHPYYPSDFWPFFNPICRDLRQNHRAELHKVFEDYLNGRTDLLEFELSVLELVEGYPDAVRKFKNMLTVLFQESDFRDKVRMRIYDNTPGYMEWLKNLSDYDKGNIYYTEFKRKVKDLFRSHPDLWEDFDRNLDRDRTDSSSD